ncbi:MAG TPA: glycine--tRNA ligase subunit beta [Terriglobia bacterium]|nr:glycine--tRNA ligase subunit beta [Terriglobia bacterium]
MSATLTQPKTAPAPRPRPDEGPKPGSTLPLVIEVGCEEIPARFLSAAQSRLAERLRAALAAAQLLPESNSGGESVRGYSTPRRLVACAPHLLKKQPDRTEETMGPPVKVAFDAEGRPTRAAQSFAEKNGVDVDDLIRKTTPKGEYLAARRSIAGRDAYEVLCEALPGVIAGMGFPKSMYWTGKSGPRFVRPIRWLLALLGEGRRARVVPFEIAGVPAGCWTYRHRRSGAGRMRVRSFADYVEKLREGMVELDPARRRATVQSEVQALLEGTGLRVVPDKDLEDWIVASTEWPKAILGGFDERFLKLPREILVTVMRDHQKYFAVENQAGGLQPRFVTVLNVEGDPRGIIRAGHERVLKARFTDAEFFWNADQKAPLASREELLTRVTYQTKLGSYAEKMFRVLAVATRIQEWLGAHAGLAIDLAVLTRAVRLSKCDLTTQMVQEFPELQGIVGGLYARAQGEPPDVWEAVYDQYLPQGMEDACPRHAVGAVVSLADKIDSVAAGFVVGLDPTGSSDPFALRRQGNGVIKILIETPLPVPLNELAYHAVYGLYGPNVEWSRSRDQAMPAVLDFLAERLRFYLEERRGFRYDTVRATISAGCQVPLEAVRRAEALEQIRGTENFEVLAAGAKRIRNILTKSATGNDFSAGMVDESKIEPGPEAELYAAYRSVSEEAGKLNAAGDYARALRAIATLRPPVDRFFDKVLVMAEDATVRQNRLRLLAQLNQLFSGIADLSQIESAT